MNYFPIFIDSSKINALIIGGGDVAARKIELLTKATSQITIMSAKLNHSVERLVAEQQLTWLAENYNPSNLEGFNLIIAATSDAKVNQQVATDAQQLNIFVNVVDQPALCSYITPAIIDRNPMLVALSSSGSAPVLVRMLREQIEKTLPNDYGKLAEFCFKFREHVKARLKSVRERRHFWEQILRGSVGEQILQGEQIQAEQNFIKGLNGEKPIAQGEIVFIHTLDGNPDKLTLQAHRAMQFADAVFYDDDVNLDLLEFVRRDAEKFPQQITATILVNFQHALELAEQGAKVIYLLDGHHPLMENDALRKSDIATTTLVSGL